MISKWLWTLRSTLRELWVRVAAFAVLALATAAVAPTLSRFVPSQWAEALGGGAVEDILNILATTMLAVTTFSLSIAVNAFTAAAQSATPRSTALLQQDPTTQATLATFLGAFVYAIVSIIGLNAGYYDAGGRVVLFLFTIVVVIVVVMALLRWIGYLPDFGRMANTLDRVEEAARAAFKTRLDAPWMGGRPHRGPAPEGATAIASKATGYVQHVDMEALQEASDAASCQIYLSVLPGDFVHHGGALCEVLGPLPDESDIRKAFTTAHNRSFDQDPGYGMVVLSEIASRALSPGVNDPGTAIAVIGRQVSVLADWRQREGPEVCFGSVHVPSIDPSDVLSDAFRPIARDGCGNLEVMMRLLAALDALASLAPEVFGAGVTALLKELDHRIETSPGLSPDDRDRLSERRAAIR